jgi:tRNA threonylcarbamoyl adenosine modification protein YeaZ
MWHLALETIGLSGSVALFKDTQLVSDFLLPPQIGSGRSLLPAIDRMVDQASISAADLGLISLAKGPGSFTGLRVSVASAKALGYALKIPLCAVDTLETLAYRLAMEFLNAREKLSDMQKIEQPAKPILIAAAMDAYRKQVFRLVALVDEPAMSQSAEKNAIQLQVLLPSHHLDVSLWKQNPFCGLEHSHHFKITDQLARSMLDFEQFTVIVGGNAVDRYPAGDVWPIPISVSDPRDICAVDVGHYAWQHWLQGTTTDPFWLLPNYLRASAAEEKISSQAE